MGTDTGGMARAAVVVVVGVVVVRLVARTAGLTVFGRTVAERFVVGRVGLLDRFGMFASRYSGQKAIRSIDLDMRTIACNSRGKRSRRHRILFDRSGNRTARTGLGLGKNRGEFFVRTRNHLHADDFADLAGGAGTGVNRSLDGGDITDNERGHKAAADFFPSDHLDIGRLEHRIDAFDQADQSFAFQHSECFHYFRHCH